MIKDKIVKKFSKYQFEIRHITIFFIVLITFQIALAFVQRSSLNDFLSETQSWYQKHSAERLATVTATSMELLFENLFLKKTLSTYDERKLIVSFNVIFKQQLVQKSVQDICLILVKNHMVYVIDSGPKILKYLKNELKPYNAQQGLHRESVKEFFRLKEKIKEDEIVYSTVESHKTFNVFVPFVPEGEYLGVMYMRITPDFSFLTTEVKSNFNHMSILYSALIFIGLLAIFVVSSQAVKERNMAQEELFREHEGNIKKQIRLEKESLFTKRIYHTHHKAEKIMGFIKEDVRNMDCNTIDVNKSRVITYSNFISRIIYDMKWYDLEINTIVNPMFQTNINDVFKFIVKNVFLRISSKNDMFKIHLDLDDSIPVVPINEFVVWEILEPIMQNSIDHGHKKLINITARTRYYPERRQTVVSIIDDGVGIDKALLQEDEKGVKKLFIENESTKHLVSANSGYGCYIAYEMAVKKCGWKLDVVNHEVGCEFIITIKN